MEVVNASFSCRLNEHHVLKTRKVELSNGANGIEITCFRDYGCNGKHVGPVGYGGYPDLRKVGNGEFNDAISSFKCFGRTYS